MTKKSLQKKAIFDRAAAIDLAIRVVLSLFFAFCAGVYCHNALGEMKKLSARSDQALGIEGLSIFAVSFYMLTVACLYILRHRPIARSSGWHPVLAALLGGFVMSALVLLKPNENLPSDWRVIGCCLVLIGNCGAVYILTHLGRSFSILPESRKLVTHGPYNYIRHPLYLVETLSSLGMMILFLSYGAAALVVLQFVFQLVRMHYEESVLTKTFPEYKSYAKRTARLIPGIY